MNTQTGQLFKVLGEEVFRFKELEEHFGNALQQLSDVEAENQELRDKVESWENKEFEAYRDVGD